MVFRNNDLVVTLLEDLPVMGHIVSLSMKPGSVAVILRTPEGFEFERDLYALEKVNLTFSSSAAGRVPANENNAPAGF